MKTRLPRIHIPNTIHHVMIRGNNRQKIFLNKTCFYHFLNIVAESTDKFDHTIHAYCLMTNHVHFIIQAHNDSLSKVMKNINYRYARWFNLKYDRIGHVFQGRYHSIAVDNIEYLINLCHYIHFNPVAAGMVDHPDQYFYSSHQYYVTQQPPKWLEINLILTAIKNKTRNTYLEFINTPVDRNKWKPGLFINEKGEFEIDYDTVKELHPTLNTIKKNKDEKIILPQELVKTIVCKNLNINARRLESATRDRKTSQQRALLAHFWMTYSDLTMKEAATNFYRSRVTLQKQLQNLSNNNFNYFSPTTIDAIQKELESKLIHTEY